MESGKPKVCVIGAGPTGLVALRHLKDIADCTAYELKDQIGGLWVYNENNDETRDKDDKFYELYGHTHESIYQDLTTIVPIYFLVYKDFPPKIKDRVHFTHKEVLEYLQDYTKHFELEKYISFNTSVLEVTKSTEGKWKVTIEKNGENSEEIFDYVVVCNGHNSVPFYPEKDIKNLKSFTGKVMHAHDFRKPDTEDFDNKNILFVGMRWSGQDLLYQFTDLKRIRSFIDDPTKKLEIPLEESRSDFKKIILSSKS